MTRDLLIHTKVVSPATIVFLGIIALMTHPPPVCVLWPWGHTLFLVLVVGGSAAAGI
jgi:hypothetical protein